MITKFENSNFANFTEFLISCIDEFSEVLLLVSHDGIYLDIMGNKMFKDCFNKKLKGKKFNAIHDECAARYLKNAIVQAIEKQDFLEINLKLEIENFWITFFKVVSYSKGSIIFFTHILQKSENSNNLLKQISYKLKTPLTTIKGYSDVVLTCKSDLNEEKIQNALEQISINCKNMEIIINQMILSSELEINPKLELKPIKLRDIVEKVLNDLNQLVINKKHNFSINIEKELIVCCDHEKIKEVFTYLISNCINYTPANGEISIFAKESQDTIIIMFKDNGIGILAKDKANLFKKFGNINQNVKSFYNAIGGLGLGLYNSKKIIKMHQGEIWVESKGRNKGSIFYIRLPNIKEINTHIIKKRKEFLTI
ncbi:MAG: sensor histidine kinase [Promethearchaeota archaeon]